MSSRTIVLTLAALLLTTAAMALETAEKKLHLEFPVDAGETLGIENLLGSVSVRMLRDPGPVRVEARVVAEGKAAEDASALANRVELLRDGESTVHVRFPMDGTASFRAPREGLKGLFSRWTAGLMRRGSSTVEYEGRSILISKDRKAAGLAVHLTVRVPADITTSIRQGVGSIDVRFVRGNLAIDTDGGSVEVISCYGDLTLNGGEADIRVASLQGGSLNVESGSGTLELDGVRTKQVALNSAGGPIQGSDMDVNDLTVSNGIGDVTFVDLVPETMDIQTAAGDIDLAFRIRKAKSASIRAGKGDVVLRMNQRLSFGLTAATKKGEVKLMGMEMELLEQDGLTSRYRSGSGGVDVAVHAPGGELTVRPYGAKTIDLLSKR